MVPWLTVMTIGGTTGSRLYSVYSTDCILYMISRKWQITGTKSCDVCS